MPEDKILSAIATLSGKVDDLTDKVRAHEKKLSWITSVALVVIGLVGGPNAARLIATGTA